MIYDNCLVIRKHLKTGLASNDELLVDLYLSEGEGEVWTEYNWVSPDNTRRAVMLLSHQTNGLEKVSDFDHPGPNVSVVINNHTFGSDSADLWENPYFSDYTTLGTYSKILYGYNTYKNFDSREYYQGIGWYQNVKCAVICKQAYIASGGTPTLVKSFEFLAKDNQNNIHLLQQIILGEASSSYLRDQTIVSQGGTTLLYPSSPSVGQIVYGGYIHSIDAAVAYPSLNLASSYNHCLCVKSGTKTLYYNAGSGLVAETYNNGADGFTTEKAIAAESSNGSGTGTGTNTGTGTDTGTGTVSSTAVADDDDDLKWYQCLISTTTSGRTDLAFIFLLLVTYVGASAMPLKRAKAD